MVLLGASNYGKRATVANSGSAWMQNGGTSKTGTATNLATSTGNISGVYELGYYNMNIDSIDYEWVAGGLNTFLNNVDLRYRDIYTIKGKGKPGDATKENGIDLANWHTGNPLGNWLNSSSLAFRRGYGDRGIFARGITAGSNSYYARAAVVCGAGL